MTQMRLDGKVAIVTGASEGIGASLAHALAPAAAQSSVFWPRDPKKNSASWLVANALITAGDLLDPRPAVGCGAHDERFGRIDLLINNAGVGLYAPSHTAPMDEARRMWELNFFAPLDLIQRVAPSMKQQRSGVIVNVGSIAGKMTLPWFTLYSASKYAIGSLTDGLRMELRSFGIHTMTVCPGYVNTRFQQNVLHGTPPALAGRSQTVGNLAGKMRRRYRHGVSNEGNVRL